MSQYVVITPEGNRYGPTDFQTLAQWASEGRVGPGMMVEDLLSGVSMTASAVPGLAFDEANPFVSPDATVPRGRGTVSMIFGLVGMLAWCLPVLGFPVGVTAIMIGIRGLGGEDRTQAIIGIVLGIVCLVLSLANLIVGALLLKSLQQP